MGRRGVVTITREVFIKIPGDVLVVITRPGDHENYIKGNATTS